MRRIVTVTGALALFVVFAGNASAAPPTSEYERDLISVITMGRHAAFPTANCLVWANAEDLGVGPKELNGYHGVTMNINLQPLPNELAKQPTPFSAGLAELKARYPTAPAWLVKTVEKNRPVIEAACAQDHETPFKVYTITSRDRQG